MQTDLIADQIAPQDDAMSFASMAVSELTITSLVVLDAHEVKLFEKHMPLSALDIAGHIGMPLTLRLLLACRGNSLRLQGKDFHFVKNLLGIDAADKLKHWIGCSDLIIPLCRSAVRVIVHNRIRAEFDKLTTVDKITARAAVRNLTNFTSPPMHERSIWRILKQSY